MKYLLLHRSKECVFIIAMQVATDNTNNDEFLKDFIENVEGNLIIQLLPTPNYTKMKSKNLFRQLSLVMI